MGVTLEGDHVGGAGAFAGFAGGFEGDVLGEEELEGGGGEVGEAVFPFGGAVGLGGRG